MGFDAAFYAKNSQKIFQAFFGYYQTREMKTRTRGGARKILSWLHGQHIPTVIFSNHYADHIRLQLKRLHLDTYINEVFGRENGASHHMHKRSKDLLLKNYVDSNKIRPKEVLVIGDTTEEIDIAKAFGYVSVALTGGQQTTTKLKAAGADYIIGHLAELKKIIR